MKKISLFIICACFACTVSAQHIALYPYVEDFAEPFPATAAANVTNKLTLLVTNNDGVAAADYLSQFFITARATPLTKDVLPGPPPQIAENIELTFFIADYVNQVVFASTSVAVKGVGNTETKAYMDALKHVNINSDKLQKFVEDGKAKIVAYYDAEAPAMLKKAKALADQKQYEAAMFIANSIPSACKFYNEATELGVSIYKLYYAEQCQKNLALARMAWAAEQNAAGAEAAGEYLALIYADAPCYDEAMTLYKEIKSKVLDDWKFKMSIYKDTVTLEKERIHAWRDVGVAYGRGQQPVTTNIAWLY